MSLCTIRMVQSSCSAMSSQRRHEFGTTNGRSVFRFFGRGETLGDVGSLGVMDVCEYDRECCHAVH